LEGVTEHEFDIYGIFSGVEIWYTLRQTKWKYLMKFHKMTGLILVLLHLIAFATCRP
jgi:hypothetical protein